VRRFVACITEVAYVIVSPLLKKPFLDPTELCNYRPVSNLTFASKVIERMTRL